MRKSHGWVCFLALLLLGFSACRPAPASLPAAPTLIPAVIVSPTPTRVPTITPPSPTPVETRAIASPTSPEADVVIHPGLGAETVSVPVGQVIAVIAPDGSDTWELAYDSEVLQQLPTQSHPEEDVREWLLQALQPGQSEIYLASVTTCPKGEACPPAMQEFVLIIEITQP